MRRALAMVVLAGMAAGLAGCQVQSRSRPDPAAQAKAAALVQAVRQGDRAAAEKLLDAGANPNIPDAKGNLALRVATERRDAQMIQLLQRRGARLDASPARPRTSSGST